MTERPYLMVATPCYGGQVTTAYTTSLLKLQLSCHAQGIEFSSFLISGDALITRARANCAARFLDVPAATHLLFVDADIGFEPTEVFRLMRFGAQMSAGAYPIKHLDPNKMRRAILEKRPNPAAAGLTYVLGLEDPKNVVIRDRFAKVRYVGNGFLMIRREALVRMCEAHPELKFKGINAFADPLGDSPHRFALFDCMIDPQTGAYLSEDYAFCRRWTNLGGEIWLDLDSKLTHVGPMHFVGDLSTQFDLKPPPGV
jgi:hypothetical protein